ncbi:unnamed protein product [Lactuca virosa]|uniref:Uncharacterized protein n=1 Tax=Lactuca virosa TaxID=75947 RepID=A0AAU9PGH3_9ASTR|nr:unnamed protein product [Lactuca virosa]
MGFIEENGSTNIMGFIEENGSTNIMGFVLEEMMKLRNEHTFNSMSNNSILENVLGRISVRLSGWGRDPVVVSNTSNTKNSKRPTYNELLDDVRKMKKRCAIMEQKMIEKNIMPLSLSILSGQSENDTSDCDTSTHTPSGQSHGENIDEFDHME